ncbi:MAG: sulfotransferase domain-containing protein [Aliidiomarina sp.]|uniref:sulfotransferase domain-containing protein n=1 Tax=Aliidiomarina sp. TaxID=1872439 RepID=UPI0025C3BA1D|nr:sulfotransferase domain-containing protein [Aliidiomarina sp.]MCH8502339.1 sulfotransferase domain-containing protein [Aliidiomarina sp.]
MDFAIIGFPKCGTTALIQELSKYREYNILKDEGAKIEYNVARFHPNIQEHIGSNLKGDALNGHKFVAYAFSKSAVRNLLRYNQNMKMILCVRTPLKALISWHNMHKRIANSKDPSNHFAYKERNFYGSCNLLSYYYNYAKERLRYDIYLERVFELVPENNLMLVYQEEMAKSTSNTLLAVADFLGTDIRDAISKEEHPSSRHVGFADKGSHEIPNLIVEELNDVYQRVLSFDKRNNIPNNRW